MRLNSVDLALMMTAHELIVRITSQILNPLIVLLFALATVLFGWGVVRYIIASQGGSDAGVTKAKDIMVWGIIGMFIMASAWGIVFLLCDFFKTCPNIGFSDFNGGSGSGTGQFFGP